MTKQWSKVFVGMILVLSLLSDGVASGDDAAPGPRQVVEQGVAQVMHLLNDPAYTGPEKQAEKEALLLKKAQGLFDFHAFAMGALGRNWRRFSTRQQDDFVAAFSQLIAQTYFDKVRQETLDDIEITYLETRKLAPTKSGLERADVFSQVTHDNVTTPVDYRMMKPPEGTWRIYDVKIEGVSLLGNYREQYRERFMDSPDQIIQEVREKVTP